MNDLHSRAKLLLSMPLGATLAALLGMLGPVGCTGVLEGPLGGGNESGGDNGDNGGPPTGLGVNDPGSGVQCQPGWSACGLDCVDLASSQDHCGQCGSACLQGEVCALGSCGLECVAPYSECGDQCVHLDQDAAHCGTCERSCSEGLPCFAGGCGCPEGALVCQGQCVDPSSSRDHCGECEAGCEADELCVAGGCVPAAEGCPLTACGLDCVDTQISPAHCGACDQRCSSGQTCQGGSCECTNPEAVICDGHCINVLADVDHCGACGRACTGGYPCTEGECACPEGQELCSETCVDTSSNSMHCGACGEACPEGETCIVGRCSGSVGDDCTSVVAGGISIREIAVFQVGKISIMDGGEAVGARAADVIAGKDGVVRVYVDTEPAFSERVLSARLTLMEGDALEQVFHKRSVSGPSVESTWNSTFNIQVPGDMITASTQYVVEVVECDDSPGASNGGARYPGAGMAALEARDVGRLRIQYIPINAPNGSNPDTSAARLAVYTQYIELMFPVAGLDTSVGSPLTVSNSISANGDGWTQALQALSSRHNQDDAPNDLYYYGLFQPSSSTYCSGGCTAGIGYVPNANNSSRHNRVSLGLSLGTRGAAEVMAHEVGHNHGRPHSPCGGVSSADTNYPHAGGQIGWWGFEWPGTLHAPDRTDIMAYCSNKWVSDYIYRHFTDRVAVINGSPLPLLDGATATWRVLLTGHRGPEWGTPYSRPTEAAGTPETATILDQLGNVVTQITVYRTLIDHLNASSILVPEPQPDWHAIVVQGELPLPFASVHSSVP